MIVLDRDAARAYVNDVLKQKGYDKVSDDELDELELIANECLSDSFDYFWDWLDDERGIE